MGDNSSFVKYSLELIFKNIWIGSNDPMTIPHMKHCILMVVQKKIVFEAELNVILNLITTQDERSLIACY